MKSFWFLGIWSIAVMMITKCTMVASYASVRCKPTTTFCDKIATKINLPSSSILRKNNALTATVKNSDDEKSKKLGGTTSTRNLFALTEVFGKITSVFNQNDEKNEMENVSQKENLQKTTLMTAGEIEQISMKIKNEYEAIFWAVSAIFTSLLDMHSEPSFVVKHNMRQTNRTTEHQMLDDQIYLK